MVLRNTFGKDERLKREQNIETLFRSGKAFSVFPLRLIWQVVPRGEDKFPARTGFSAPKKKFRKAVSRNRLKRLMREAWRLQKAALYAVIPADAQLHLFIIYTDSKEQPYETVYNAVTKGIATLQTNAFTFPTDA